MNLKIDQILAGYADGDAISSEARAIRDILQAMGHESGIYTDLKHTSPELVREVADYQEYRRSDILIHHFSTGSPVVDTYLGASAKKVLIYHNITPAEYFQPYDAAIARQLRSARADLARVANLSDMVWADSAFNASEMVDAGAPDVAVLPLLFNEAECVKPDDPVVKARLSGPLKTFLTVSRIAPNKRIEHAIRAFSYYVKAINPYSRLVIVGSGRGCPKYFDLLQMMVGDLDIPNVCFEGFASVDSLSTYYRCADLFLSTSDHEGYCLPIVEAMYHGVPVLARKTGGTPEAMDGAGVLYDDLLPSELAVVMDELCSRSALREEVLASQRQRIDRVRARRPEKEISELLKPLLV